MNDDIQSQSVDVLNQALCKVQAEIKNPHKTGENPHFRSKYAKLDHILDEVRPILAKHGISLSQGTFPVPNGLGVYTLISKGNEWRKSAHSVPVPTDFRGNLAQHQGSQITYFRRYQLTAMLGIDGDDDTDGNDSSIAPTNAPASSGNGPERRAMQPNPSPASDPAQYVAQVKKFQGQKLGDLDLADVERYLIFCKEKGFSSKGIAELESNFLALKNKRMVAAATEFAQEVPPPQDEFDVPWN